MKQRTAHLWLTAAVVTGIAAAAAADTGLVAGTRLQIYRIRRGDTLAGIASLYYGDMFLYGFLAERNGIPDPDRIDADARLVVPPPPVGGLYTGPVEPYVFHRAGPGETLADVARRYYGDDAGRTVLAERNGIDDPAAALTDGRVLMVPPRSAAMAATEKAAGTETSAPFPAADGSAAAGPAPVDAAASPATTGAPAAGDGTAAVSADGAAGLPVPGEDVPFEWRKVGDAVSWNTEMLKFNVRWKFISVGTATMEIRGVKEVDGRQAYHIFSSARSAPFFDNFYKVRDTNESWMDVESLCSLRFESHINENNHKRDEVIRLDQPARRYVNEHSGETGEIPLWSQDVLSSLYYLRTRPLEVGKTYSIDTHSGDKSWPLIVKVLRKERVKVPAGKFDCFVVEPAVRENAGIFQAKGSLLVWITDDEHRMPVLMRSKIAVGSIVAELKHVERSAE